MGRARSSTLVRLLACAVVAVVVQAAPASPQEDGTGLEQRTVEHLQVVRFAGANRVSTAALIGRDTSGAGFGGESVVVARADAFPDSLAGSYLAGVLRAPVLLTDPSTVAPDLAAALVDIDPDSVVLLGGVAAIDEGVEAELAASFAVQRVAGENRFSTAANVARQMGDPSPEGRGLALVASGEEFPDALAAGAIAAAEEVPLLLTGREQLPSETAAALQDLHIDEVLLAGGTAAVGEDVVAAIRALGIDVARVGGANRQATARQLAEVAVERFGWAADHVSLVSGHGFPDAVAMAPHAGLHAGGPSPIALSAGDVLGAETAAWFEDLAACTLTGVDIAGGQAAVPTAVEEAAIEALLPDEGCDPADPGDPGDPGDPDDPGQPDTVPPVIAFTAPDDGAVVTMRADGITLAGTADDAGSGIARVEVRVDAFGDEVVAVAVPEGDGPFTWSIDVTPAEPGMYTFTATAVDAAGNAASADRTVEVVFPAEDEVLVFDDVRVLDAAGRACVQEFDGSSLLLACAQRGLRFRTGEVIVSEPTTAAPEGLAQRLGTCVSEGTGVRCAAAPVPLTEIFGQVDTTVQVPVTPTLGAAATPSHDSVSIEPVPASPSPPAPVDPSRERPAIILRPGGPGPATGSVAKRLIDEHWRTTFDVDLGEETGLPLPLRLEGTIEAFFYVDVALDIDIEWCWFVPCGAEVEHFKAELGGGEKLTAAYQLATEGDGQLDIDPLQLGSISLGSVTFTFGPIPVVISGELQFEIGIDGTLSGAITGRATQTLTLATGVEYRDDEWHDLSRIDWEHDFSRVRDDTAQLAGQVRPYVGVSLVLEIYTVDGPFVRGEPYVLIDVDSARDPWFNLYLGFRAVAGIEVDALGIDYESQLLDVRTLVATSASYPPESPPSVTIVGPDGFPLEVDGGFSQVAPGSPRQFFCCDVVLDYSADLSQVAEPPEDLVVRWYARDVETNTSRALGEAGPDVARLTLPPGTWDITGRVETRSGGNVRGTQDVVRVRVWDTHGIAVTPATLDDEGALGLARSIAPVQELVVGARFEVLPDGLTVPHGRATPGPCQGQPLAFRDCPEGVAGLRSGALLTTGSAEHTNRQREPAAPASPGSQATVTEGVRGDSDANVTVLAVDVDVPESASCLRFDYRFMTEELPDFLGTRFNDAFVAELDATTWTTSGSELSAPGSFALTPNGLPVAVNNLTGDAVDDVGAAATTYERATPILRAATPVAPGPHTLYLSIFDQGDRAYDSAVVLADLVAINAPAAQCTPSVAPRPTGPELTR